MKTLLTSTALVAMLATGATANTLSSNDTVDWAGNSGDGNNGISTVACTFVETVDGTMEIGADGKTWTTTADATVEILVRNGYSDATGANNLDTSTNPGHYDFKYALGNITVEPVSKDGATVKGSVWSVDDEFDAKVDYDNAVADLVTNNPANWSNVTVTPGTTTTTDSETLTITADTAQSGTVRLSIGGTAVVALPTNTVLDANTEYKVRHRVTCMQNGTSGQWVGGVDTTP
jgi:hypothetical protein